MDVLFWLQAPPDFSRFLFTAASRRRARVMVHKERKLRSNLFIFIVKLLLYGKCKIYDKLIVTHIVQGKKRIA